MVPENDKSDITLNGTTDSPNCFLKIIQKTVQNDLDFTITSLTDATSLR